MKITDVKTFVVYCYRTNYVFVKVYTDSGITGVGEGTLEYKEFALTGAIEHLKDFLLGKDPRQIEWLTHRMYRDSYWRVGPVMMAAVSTIEMALWDILGKFAGLPVYQLLGGKVRDGIRMYANGWFAGAKEPDEFARKAEEAVARGVTALKWDPFETAYMHLTEAQLRRSIRCVKEVREAVGPEVDLLIECHGRLDTSSALRVANELAPYRPMWFEEPVPPDCQSALAEVRQKSPVPIAAGERIYGIHQYSEFINARCADFLQPDVSHAGGIMEIKKIAAMAEARHVEVAPHNPSGPVANAATLQLAGNLSNFVILEIMLTDVEWRAELTDEAVTFSDGEILIPDRPGLGIELNEEACKRYPYQPIHLRHYEGTLTDIRPKRGTKFYFHHFG